MGLDAEQLKALRGLKKDLSAGERQPDSAAITVSTPERTASQRLLECAPAEGSQLKRLFDRLATPEEGIERRTPDGWQPLPLNDFDASVFGLSVDVGKGPKKIALGFPRVPTGNATWLAVATMISRVSMAGDNPLQGPQRPRWIVITARDRPIRDSYFAQRITFTEQNLFISEFPAYRIKRTGEVLPISAASPTRLSSPVLFYHFDALDSQDFRLDRLDARLVLAELSETDSRLAPELLKRLENLRTALDDPRTIVFFNSFDDRQRECLQEAGYLMLHVRPKSLDPTVIPRLPSLASAFADFNYSQRVVPDVIEDDGGISKSLYDAALAIARVADVITAPESRTVIGRWWGIWRTLKDLAAPLESYERYRTHAQRRGSLEAAIDRVSTSGDRLSGPESRTVRAVAPTVAESLRAIYRLLSQHSPKADRLLHLSAGIECSATGSLIVLPEKAQMEALREYLLLRDQKLLDRIRAAYLARAPEASRQNSVEEMLITGAWAPWHDSLLLAVGASRIRVLMYEYEASLLLRRLDEHAAESARLAGDTSAREDPILAIQVGDLEKLKALIESRRQIVEEGRDQHQPPVPSATEIEEEYEIPDDRDYGEKEAGLTIVFTDGSSLQARPHTELLIVTEDGVESVFASNVSAGEQIALIPEEEARSIFDSVLSRVKHLVQADPEVLELWRGTVRRLVFGGDFPARSIGQMVRELRALGCRRHQATIQNWFKGVTLAPREITDIQLVLQLGGAERPLELAKVVRREIEVVRNFNRRLGRRIRRKLVADATGESAPRERIDYEIDEAIEDLEYRTVQRVIQSGVGS